MTKTNLLIVLLIIQTCLVCAQKIEFKHITGADGLGSDMIHCITQDDDDFMWIGTENGLSRYNGYSCLNFLQSPTDSSSLSNNIVNSLALDNNHQLWIGTHQGLNKLDLRTYKITRFHSDEHDALDTHTIRSLLVSPDNKLWVGSDMGGLYCIDLNTHAIVNYSHNSLDSTSVVDNDIKSLLQDSQNRLFIGTNNGLDLFNPGTQTFTHLLKNESIAHLDLQKDGSILIGLIASGNYYLKLNNDLSLKKVTIPLEFVNKKVIPFSDSEGNLWLSISDHGILYCDDITQQPFLIKHNKNETLGISSNNTKTIFEDRFGDIWLGSFDAGINVFEKRHKPFMHIKDNNAPDGLQNNRVRAIYQDSEDNIWIGTKDGGTLSLFNRENFSFTHYKHSLLDPHSLSNDYIICMTEDKPGYLWVGTLNGLNYFDVKSGKSTVIYHDEKDVNSPNSNGIYALLKDSDDLYVGTVKYGLDIYNTRTHKWSHHQNNGNQGHLSDDRVKTLYKDKAENIWVGTQHGLNLYDKKMNTFEYFVNNPTDSNSISENYILSIHEDKHNNLWVGTSFGINLMNRQNNTFKTFTTADGLAGNFIKGILEDSEGHLWISTNNGLSRFNYTTKTFKNYNIHDGLQSNEFSPFVCCKTADGEMLFGGNNGFNLFDPLSIVDNQIIPRIVFTSFKLFNKEVAVGSSDSPLKSHISHTNSITLDYKQNVISFGYVALNYTSSENNRYAYKMEGFEEQWNDVNTKREANYTNLDAGDYIFRVKASNNDGHWNEKGVAIHLKVLPAPWRTWWAYALYLIITLVIIYWAYHNWVLKNKQKQEHEIDLLKINFFANISHEFRTPLSLIIAPLEKMLKNAHTEEEDKQLKMMHRNTRRLLNLVNQLLDFQKVGSGQLKRNNSLGDIVQFTKDLSHLFIELSDKKDIRFDFHSEMNKCNAMFDHNKMEKIIFNLLSNAFKFTPNNGHVSITLSLDKTNERLLIIEVKDNGIGIAPQEIDKVFSRFYQVQNHISNQGSGIGLALVKEYTEIHEGKISIESQPNEGACFKLHLPIVALNANKNNIPVITTIQQINTTLETNHNTKATQERDKPLLLLVEDNDDFRQLLKDDLSPYYTIQEASNGLMGLQKTLEHLPDLIISDVMMPKMDGNVLCQKIKNDKRTSHIPVILLSAQTTQEHYVAAFDSGADQYVTKPCSVDVLHSRIKSLLAHHKKSQELFQQKLDVTPSEITITSIDEELIQKALDIIEQNITNPNYSVDELSHELEISRGHLYRKIMSITGKSPSAFIRSIRLKRGAQLLRSSRLTVSEITYKVGFSSPKYFTKCFKAEFDTLPSQFSNKSIMD